MNPQNHTHRRVGLLLAALLFLSGLPLPAQTVTPGENDVWTFPSGYTPTPLNYSGIFQMEGPSYPPMRKHVGRTLTWASLNPSEGIYNFDYIDTELAAAESGGYGVVFRLKASIYNAVPDEQGQGGSQSQTIPGWVITKYGLSPTHIFRTSDPAVVGTDDLKEYASPWHAGVQAEFEKLLREIGRRRYPENNACLGFYLHGFSNSSGEEMGVTNTTYANNADAAAIAAGFTAATYGNALAAAIMDCWPKRMDWWEQVAGPHVYKIAFVNAGEMPGKPYPAASLEALSQTYGLGERHGNIEEYYYGNVSPPKQGQTYLNSPSLAAHERGYVEMDWNHALHSGRYWGDENEQMSHYKMPGGGQPSAEVRALCYRSSFFRAAQLGMNFLWTSRDFIDSAGNLDGAADANDLMPQWWIYNAGKGPSHAPDAVCWLREAWIRQLPDPTTGDPTDTPQQWKNLERFLMQRDLPASSGVTGAMSVPTLALDFPYVSLKKKNAPSGAPEVSDNEYTARRTDIAGGNPHLAFKLEPAFRTSIVNEGQPVQVRVHYYHNTNAPFTVRVARNTAPYYVDLGTVPGSTPTNTWKTAIFTMSTSQFPQPNANSGLGSGIDFVVRATGAGSANDLTVRYVRVVRTAEIAVAPWIRAQPDAKSVQPGDTANFWIHAEGHGTLSYRWQKNNSDLSDDGVKYEGAATAHLKVMNLVSGDAGNYRCIVSNNVGLTRTVTSNNAALDVGYTAVIDNFPSATLNASWNKSSGGKAVTIAGDSAGGSAEGTYHLRIDFPDGGTWKYAQLVKNTATFGSTWAANNVKAITFWIKGSATIPHANLKFQLREGNTGERWNFNIGNFVKTTGWTKVTVPLSKPWLEKDSQGSATGTAGEFDLTLIDQIRFYSDNYDAQITIRVDDIRVIEE